MTVDETIRKFGRNTVYWCWMKLFSFEWAATSSDGQLRLLGDDDGHWCSGRINLGQLAFMGRGTRARLTHTGMRQPQWRVFLEIIIRIDLR